MHLRTQTQEIACWLPPNSLSPVRPCTVSGQALLVRISLIGPAKVYFGQSKSSCSGHVWAKHVCHCQLEWSSLLDWDAFQFKSNLLVCIDRLYFSDRYFTELVLMWDIYSQLFLPTKKPIVWYQIELCTDKDMYSIEFPSKKPKTTKQKQKKLEEKPKTANVKKNGRWIDPCD